jgi:hypothetical protein
MVVIERQNYHAALVFRSRHLYTKQADYRQQVMCQICARSVVIPRRTEGRRVTPSQSRFVEQ